MDSHPDRAQRERGPIKDIRPGDLVWFEPGEKHRHGATLETAAIHIVIAEARDGKVAEWPEHVPTRSIGARSRSRATPRTAVTPL